MAIQSIDNIKHGIHVAVSDYDMYEIQRSNNFEFVVVDLDADAQEVLRYSVNQAAVPHFTQESIQIRRGNSVLKAAGTPTFGDGTLEINDYIGSKSKEYLMAWQQLSYNWSTDTVGKMSRYKKDCYLIEYTPEWEAVRTWKLVGCWVSGISEGNYSMDDTGKRTVTATITYDYGYIEDASVKFTSNT